MNRSFRKIVSVVTLAAVLILQFAVSAYACPMLANAAADQTPVMDQSKMPRCAVADMPDIDTVQPGLCQQHCVNGQQIVNDLPFDPASIAFVPVFVVNLPAFESSPPQLIASLPSLHHATSPSLAVRHCCFRI